MSASSAIGMLLALVWAFGSAACSSARQDSENPGSAGGTGAGGNGAGGAGAEAGAAASGSGGGAAAGGGAATGGTSGAAGAGGGGAGLGGGSGGTSPSGEPMPTGDLPQFKQIFADDFTQDVPLGSFPTAVASTWGAYPSPWNDTSKNGEYDPAAVVSIADGVMKLHLHTANGKARVAAPYPRLPNATANNGQLYGRYAIRFRADPVEGFKTAWLLWPDSETWPRDGEIDFPEGDLNDTISAFMHWQNGTKGSDQDAYPTTITYTSWHTAVTEWTPTATRFTLDGKVIGSSTQKIPNTPMHYVIQTETRLSGGPPPTSAAGDVLIDWVVVHRYAP